MEIKSNTRYLYFDVNYAVSVHDWIIKNSGGLVGIKSIGQIESILVHMQNDSYYPEFEDKLAHLVFSIIKVHAFNDGNKRSSLALGVHFLAINGFDYLAFKFVQEMENIVVLVAENIIDKFLLREIITELVYDFELSEQTKLSLLRAISTTIKY